MTSFVNVRETLHYLIDQLKGIRNRLSKYLGASAVQELKGGSNSTPCRRSPGRPLRKASSHQRGEGAQEDERIVVIQLIDHLRGKSVYVGVVVLMSDR